MPLPLLLAGAGVVSNIIGGIAGKNAGSDAAGKANDAMNIAFQELDRIGLPPNEAREIVYKQFEQQGLMTPELEQNINQKSSEMGNITEDPALKNSQMEALQILQKRGKGGLTPEDRSALNELRTKIATDTEAKRQQILQNFQARGQAGGGAELIAALQGSQSGANEESAQGDRLAAMASQNALQSIGQAGTLSSQIRGQEFGEASDKAKAQDVINQFNIQNQTGIQSRNVGAKNAAEASNLNTAQQISNANTQQANQELLRQREAERQQWQDEMQRQQVRSGARMQEAGALQNKSASDASQAAAPWQAIGAGLTTIGTAKKWDGGEIPRYSDGGDVKLDPDKLKQAQDSMRRAFGGNYADGGDVQPDPEIERLKKIFPNVSEEHLREIHERASHPENHIEKSNARPSYMSPQESQGPVDPNNAYANTARILSNSGQGYSYGGTTDYRDGGGVPGQAPVPGDSPKNDIVDAKLSPGEYVIKRSQAKSPFGKKLIKLLEAHSEVMKHAPKDE